MRFLETHVFTELVGENLVEDDYRALQTALLLRPEQGPIIPGSGGLRKIRWGAKGRGKRGGIRVIYFWDKATATAKTRSFYTVRIGRVTLRRRRSGCWPKLFERSLHEG